MRRNFILFRYLVKEMLPPFGVNLLFFTFIFLLTRLLEITNLVVNYRVRLTAVFQLLLYSIPYYLEYIIPMSVMMAVLLAILRMSNDNEITALKAGGISIYGLLSPVVVFSIIGALLTALITIYGLPWGRLSFKNTLIDLTTSNMEIGLKARNFTDDFEGVMLYVNEIDPRTRNLRDVFIEDGRTQGAISVVVAPKGHLVHDPEHLRAQLRLFDGVINTVNAENRTVHTIDFETYTLSLDIRKMVVGMRRGATRKEEMSLEQLTRFIKHLPKKDPRYYSARMEYHEKFSIPFACLVLGVLAIPLGLRPMQARRSFGVIAGMAYFLFYYLMLMVGWTLGESGRYPPILGMWMPNAVTAVLGIVLLWRAGREETLGVEKLMSFFKRHETARRDDSI